MYSIQKSRAVILESLNGRWFNFNKGACLQGSPFVLVTGPYDEFGQAALCYKADESADESKK
jgi:hypothetical protein